MTRGPEAASFPPTSRYAAIAIARLERPDGRVIVYLTRRFLPDPDRLAVVHLHRVAEQDRLDNVAAKYLGDPEASWQICDANRAMDPTALTETVGRVLRITLPAGVPGPPNG